LVWTDEAPLEHLLLAVWVLDWVADVEDLAIVGHVSVVAVPLALAAEFVHYLLADRLKRQCQENFLTDLSMGMIVVN
jgi:hypothetical protein